MNLSYARWKALFLAIDEESLYHLMAPMDQMGAGWGPVQLLAATDEAEMRAAVLDLLRADYIELRHRRDGTLGQEAAEAAAINRDLWHESRESFEYFLVITDVGVRAYAEVRERYDPGLPPGVGPARYPRVASE